MSTTQKKVLALVLLFALLFAGVSLSVWLMEITVDPQNFTSSDSVSLSSDQTPTLSREWWPVPVAIIVGLMLMILGQSKSSSQSTARHSWLTRWYVVAKRAARKMPGIPSAWRSSTWLPIIISYLLIILGVHVLLPQVWAWLWLPGKFFFWWLVIGIPAVTLLGVRKIPFARLILLLWLTVVVSSANWTKTPANNAIGNWWNEPRTPSSQNTDVQTEHRVRSGEPFTISLPPGTVTRWEWEKGILGFADPDADVLIKTLSGKQWIDGPGKTGLVLNTREEPRDLIWYFRPLGNKPVTVTIIE